VAELRGHGGLVSAIAFDSEGKRLVSGSGDFTIRLWVTIPPQRRAD
jgi:WD40 repeat protein